MTTRIIAVLTFLALIFAPAGLILNAQEAETLAEVQVTEGETAAALEANIASPSDGYQAKVGQSISFVSAVTGGRFPYSYAWHFGDGTDALGPDFSKSYAAAGTYTVQLEVRDFSNTTASDSIQITITADDGGGNPSDPLTITNISITDITQNSAIVHWTTNRVATSRVIYDTTSHSSIATSSAPNFGYANSTGTSDVDTKVTEHAVSVTGLAANTTYYFRVISQE